MATGAETPQLKHIGESDEESQTVMQLNHTLQVQHTILVCIASVGILGNVVVMGAILSLRSLRKCSSAFLFHQCFLDLLKSLNCLLWAQTILTETEPMFCGTLGGSFIVCVTATAFNMLGMVMNEAYIFADLSVGVRDSANYCCVLFSVSTIWFASIILNLGVAFLPGSAKYIPSLGVCMFQYGVTRHYVLHVLWILLVTFALLLTSLYLKKLHEDIHHCRYSKVSELLPNLSQMITMMPVQEDAAAQMDEMKQTQWKRLAQHTRQRLHKLLLMVALFIAFWYPLFMLTVLDQHFKAPPLAYKILLIFACCNSSINPYLFWSIVVPKFSWKRREPTNINDHSGTMEEEVTRNPNIFRSHKRNHQKSGSVRSSHMGPLPGNNVATSTRGFSGQLVRTASPIAGMVSPSSHMHSPAPQPLLANSQVLLPPDYTGETGIFNEFFMRTDPQPSSGMGHVPHYSRSTGGATPRIVPTTPQHLHSFPLRKSPAKPSHSSVASSNFVTTNF